MAISPKDLRISSVTMDHARGAWPGSRPQRWTARHVPSGVAVSWTDYARPGGSKSQHHAHPLVLAALEMLVDDLGGDVLPEEVREDYLDAG